MSWINVIDEEDAEGDLRKTYNEIIQKSSNSECKKIRKKEVKK